MVSVHGSMGEGGNMRTMWKVVGLTYNNLQIPPIDVKYIVPYTYDNLFISIYPECWSGNSSLLHRDLWPVVPIYGMSGRKSAPMCHEILKRLRETQVLFMIIVSTMLRLVLIIFIIILLYHRLGKHKFYFWLLYQQCYTLF